MLRASVRDGLVDLVLVGVESFASCRRGHQCVQQPLAADVAVVQTRFGPLVLFVVQALRALDREAVFHQIAVGDSEGLWQWGLVTRLPFRRLAGFREAYNQIWLLAL